VGAALIHAYRWTDGRTDGRTDVMNLIGAFGDYMNARNKLNTRVTSDWLRM
jgi:hypothetical protein